MGQALLQIRVDSDLKARTAEVYRTIGIDLPTAVRMFFKRSVLVGGLPFEARVSKPWREREESGLAAWEAFEYMRQKVAERGLEEPTADEINAIITDVRTARRQKTNRTVSK